MTPTGWDDDGQVSAVALCATDDEAYYIENGIKFLGLTQKSIEATGRVTRGKKTSRSIFIKRFEVLDSF